MSATASQNWSVGVLTPLSIRPRQSRGRGNEVGRDRRLPHSVGGQSPGMSSHDGRTVANPDRTRVDDDPTRLARDEKDDDPHDRSRPTAARQSEREADGPPH
jgi:hypothetical protein